MRRARKQAWERNVAEKAERLIRNLARRFAQEAPDVSQSILEGRDEIVTVIRLGLPPELRRSLASTNIIGTWVCLATNKPGGFWRRVTCTMLNACSGGRDHKA